MRNQVTICCVLLALTSAEVFAGGDDVQFNTDVLDVSDRKNIDLTQFSRAGFVMPGDYTLGLQVNSASLQESNIRFLAPENDPKGSVACLSPALVKRFGLKGDVFSSLHWWHSGECLDPDDSALKGMQLHTDLGTSTLTISIPQAYMEYTSPNWDAPATWDDGVAGVLMDYSFNAQKTQGSQFNLDSTNVSGNGVVGANYGAWRLRADWQANRVQSDRGDTRQQVEWSRYYLYRAIRSLHAKLTLGESYLSSELFDSVRYTGVSLATDDNQLPPNLRGYAPEITGIANSNAKVTVSQKGHVLYETQVAQGPFRIQALNSSTSGTLDVTVTEQDGSIRKFQVNTPSVPYLSRPGTVRYKLATGRPGELTHQMNGPAFTTGELSWGVNNGWSLFGGAILGERYNALATGIGRDLYYLGAMSFDITSSRAELPYQGTLSGNSYRVNYSKTFDAIDSQVTFAGYRFSEKNYMTLSQYLDTRLTGERNNGSKEMFTVSFNKRFRDIGLTTYLNLSRQTYWNNAAPTVRYMLTMAKNFDFGPVKNMSISLAAYRNQYHQVRDRGGYLSLSVPFGNSGMFSYSGSMSNDSYQQSAGYGSQLDDHNTYQMNVGMSQSGAIGSASLTHQGNMQQLTANVGYAAGRYNSLGLSVSGGVTATAHGVALHRQTELGGTRMMLGTDGISGVPVHGYGSTVDTNLMGVAVISDVNSYYRNEASIDLNNLPDNVEVDRSVAAATLTEGAIGWRRFDMLSGEKAMVVIMQQNNSPAPFGAAVNNARGQQTGLVGDDGNTWLTGMNPGESMDVRWDGKKQCTINLPAKLNARALLLPCR